MSREVYVSIAIAKIHWGYSVRAFPGSTTQHSYFALPSTTIVGALAYHYNRFIEVHQGEDMYLSPMKFVEDFWPIYSTISFLDLEVPLPRTLQMIKYLSAPYRARADVSSIYDRLAVSELRSPIGIGYVVAPTQRIAIVVVSGKPIPRDVVWSIVRLGNRESLVSIDEVYSERTRIEYLSLGTEVRDINTLTPKFLVKNCVGLYHEESIPLPLTLDEWKWIYSYRARIQRAPILRAVLLPLPRIESAILAQNAFLLEFKTYDLKVLIPQEIFVGK